MNYYYREDIVNGVKVSVSVDGPAGALQPEEPKPLFVPQRDLTVNDLTSGYTCACEECPYAGEDESEEEDLRPSRRIAYDSLGRVKAVDVDGLIDIARAISVPGTLVATDDGSGFWEWHLMLNDCEEGYILYGSEDDDTVVVGEEGFAGIHHEDVVCIVRTNSPITPAGLLMLCENGGRALDPAAVDFMDDYEDRANRSGISWAWIRGDVE